MIVSFSIFCRRFHNKTMVWKKNENVNIPTYIQYIEQNINNKIIRKIIRLQRMQVNQNLLTSEQI